MKQKPIFQPLRNLDAINYFNIVSFFNYFKITFLHLNFLRQVSKSGKMTCKLISLTLTGIWTPSHHLINHPLFKK